MSNQFDTLLKNGTVVTYSETEKKVISQKTDLGIKNGKIAHIGQTSDSHSTHVVDLNGLTVLPGIIDSQVHFREPGLTHKEDIESGSRAALLGGITTFFEMPNTTPSTTTQALFQDKINLSKNRAHTNYAYFIGGCAENVFQLPELERLPHCSGVKIFLGSSFGNLLIDRDDVFEKIMQNGKRRIVIHSEDEARLQERRYIAVNSGDPKDHPVWRDEESAMISTRKSIHFAKKWNRKVHILHISSSEEMLFLKNHKDIATVEILPQYLLLSAPECYEKYGTLAQQNPPIRDKRHLEFLWKAVLDGTVDVMGSDHAPHTMEEKNKPYPQSHSGIPGVQTMLTLMLDQVHKQKLPLEKLVELLTENPRKTFGLKNKGRIQVGYDADLTIVDLKKSQTIEKKWLASKVGWSPFEGMTTTGWPVMAFLNGEMVLQDQVIIKPHAGLACEFE